MPKLPVESLKPGMKLSKPVTNDSGMILFGEGTELTEALITRLSNMSIQGVFVTSDAVARKPKEEVLTELDRRFAKTINEPNMLRLKNIFIQHIEGMYK